ncbi:GNAT family N-acetyltransferase [Roseateles sp. UC29_93]|uniref:GNAT family N-acetyltransferase n=1 Tax=Roseateles sp. UC29_93 TaxID=3350177 RepID=UPI00367302C6
MLEHRVTLRPTMLSDLDFVVGVEQDAGNRPFITPWERTQHEGAVRFPDARHFIVELDAERAGFVILQGCRNPNRSVELKRIVLGPKGQGVGRLCVRLLKKMAFTQLGGAPLLAGRERPQHAGAIAVPQRGLCRGRPAARMRAGRAVGRC